MYEGRDRLMWNHTGSVLAMIANTIRDPAKRRKPFTVLDFHPDYAGRSGGGKIRLTGETLRRLKRFGKD